MDDFKEQEQQEQKQEKDQDQDQEEKQKAAVTYPPANNTIFSFRVDVSIGSLDNLYFYYQPLLDLLVWTRIGTADQGATKDLRTAWLWRQDPDTSFYNIILNLDYASTPENQKIWKTGSPVTLTNTYALTAVYTPGTSGKAGKYEGVTLQLTCLNGTKNSSGQYYISTWTWNGGVLAPDTRSIGTPPSPGIPPASISPPDSKKPLYLPVALSSSSIEISYVSTQDTKMLAASRNVANACLCRDRIIYASGTLSQTSCLVPFIKSFLPSSAASDSVGSEFWFQLMQDVISTLGYLPPYFRPLLLSLSIQQARKEGKLNTKTKEKVKGKEGKEATKDLCKEATK